MMNWLAQRRYSVLYTPLYHVLVKGLPPVSVRHCGVHPSYRWNWADLAWNFRIHQLELLYWVEGKGHGGGHWSEKSHPKSPLPEQLLKSKAPLNVLLDAVVEDENCPEELRTIIRRIDWVKVTVSE